VGRLRREPHFGIWDVILQRLPTTFADFWAKRAAAGHDTSDAGARGCLCQNTIAALHTYVCALGALRGLVQLVAGKMRRFEPREGDEVVVAERPQGTYVRQVFLGDALDSERVQANCQLGVLTLTIPLPRRPSRGACRSAGARTPRRSRR
jgi:hypothetical protein